LVVVDSVRRRSLDPPENIVGDDGIDGGTTGRDDDEEEDEDGCDEAKVPRDDTGELLFVFPMKVDAGVMLISTMMIISK
jgi:hypothetical protein